MFVPHRKHIYGPPRPVTGPTLVLRAYINIRYGTTHVSLPTSLCDDKAARAPRFRTDTVTSSLAVPCVTDGGTKSAFPVRHVPNTLQRTCEACRRRAVPSALQSCAAMRASAIARSVRHVSAGKSNPIYPERQRLQCRSLTGGNLD
jgi:hypothetical protein